MWIVTIVVIAYNHHKNGKVIIMYINNERETVDSHIVSDEDILKTIFKFCPQVVFSDILSRDFSNYIATIPEHCNSTILRGVSKRFQHIIDNNFIKVIEDGSFGYDYGDISSTHHCTILVGYVPRTPEFEKIATEPWEDYY